MERRVVSGFHCVRERRAVLLAGVEESDVDAHVMNMNRRSSLRVLYDSHAQASVATGLHRTLCVLWPSIPPLCNYSWEEEDSV